jgi:hypothetical protein
MMPLDYVLAVAALTATGGWEEGDRLHEHACLARPVRTVALHWEILDHREARSVLGRPDDFAVDLQLLRRRYRELVDAPPLVDCMRFPGRELVCELLAFNRDYHARMTRRRDAEGKDRTELNDAVAETDQLYHIWDLVRDARSEFYYVSVRRQALAALREALGWSDYYRGVLPPHVPVWRFARMD